jgi:hypothetical protein
MKSSNSDPREETELNALLRTVCEPEYALRDWLGTLRENQQRNLSAAPEFYEQAARIDEFFQRLVKAVGLTPAGFGMNPEFILLLRAHSAFLTTTALVFNGQFAEAHMVMRGCIEAALYALLARKTPALGRVWSERDQSAERKRAARGAFTAGRGFKELEQQRPTIAGHVHKLYEDTISYGSHPNIGAIHVSTTVIDSPHGRPKLAICYVGGIGHPFFEVCLWRLTRVGFATADIFAGIYESDLSGFGLERDISLISKWHDTSEKISPDEPK